MNYFWPVILIQGEQMKLMLKCEQVPLLTKSYDGHLKVIALADSIPHFERSPTWYLTVG